MQNLNFQNQVAKWFLPRMRLDAKTNGESLTVKKQEKRAKNITLNSAKEKKN